MVGIPKTSVALLNAIAASHESPRWVEFYNRYQPVMAAFIQKHFSSLEVEEIIQEAMIAFMNKVPTYKYEPDESGCFHNYLLGIVKFKAYEAFRRRKREADMNADYEDELNSGGETSADRQLEKFYGSVGDQLNESFDESVAEIVLRQFFEDTSVKMRDREVFRRTACDGESPESVAKAYGITRNNVDQINMRARKRIRDRAEELKNLRS